MLDLDAKSGSQGYVFRQRPTCAIVSRLISHQTLSIYQTGGSGLLSEFFAFVSLNGRTHNAE